MIGQHEIAGDLDLVRVHAGRFGDLVHDSRIGGVFHIQDRQRHAFHVRDIKKVAFLIDSAAVSMSRQVAVSQQTHVPTLSARCHLVPSEFALAISSCYLFDAVLRNVASLLNCALGCKALNCSKSSKRFKPFQIGREFGLWEERSMRSALKVRSKPTLTVNETL